MQLSNKQTDPKNAFIEKKASRLKNAVGNGECQNFFEKIKNFRSSFDDNWPKKILERISQHAAQLNGGLTISSKTLAFPSLL